MKNKYCIIFLTSIIFFMHTNWAKAPISGGDPIEPIIYAPFYHNNDTSTEPQFDPYAPGFNVPDDDPKFHGLKPLPFKPENLSTGKLYGSDKNMIGYFWNTKDTDPSIIYPGKARIGNDQFINVTIIMPKDVDTTGLADSFSYTDVEDIYDRNSAEKKKFSVDFLAKIGTIIIGTTTYDLYGQYESTIVPDSESVQNPLYVDVKN